METFCFCPLGVDYTENVGTINSYANISRFVEVACSYLPAECGLQQSFQTGS